MPALTAATIASIASLGGKVVGALSSAGRERRAMLREAVDRRKSGIYGMSAAEKRQTRQDIIGAPSAGDATGSVGKFSGVLSGRAGALLLKRRRERQDASAAAGAEANRLSQAKALIDSERDIKTIEAGAERAQETGAAVGGAIGDIAGTLIEEARDKKKSKALAAAEALADRSPAEKAAEEV